MQPVSTRMVGLGLALERHSHSRDTFIEQIIPGESYGCMFVCVPKYNRDNERDRANEFVCVEREEQKTDKEREGVRGREKVMGSLMGISLVARRRCIVDACVTYRSWIMSHTCVTHAYVRVLPCVAVLRSVLQ